MKRKLLDIAFICTIISAVVLFDWNSEMIQVFITGGLSGCWLTLRLRRG